MIRVVPANPLPTGAYALVEGNLRGAQGLGTLSQPSFRGTIYAFFVNRAEANAHRYDRDCIDVMNGTPEGGWGGFAQMSRGLLAVSCNQSPEKGPTSSDLPNRPAASDSSAPSAAERRDYYRRGDTYVPSNLGATRTIEVPLGLSETFEVLLATVEELGEDIAISNKSACTIQGKLKRHAGALGLSPSYRGFDISCEKIDSENTRVKVTAFYLIPSAEDLNRMYPSANGVEKLLDKFVERLNSQVEKILDKKPKSAIILTEVDLGWFVESGRLGGFPFGAVVSRSAGGSLELTPGNKDGDFIHPGVDIAADRGGRIYSPVDGIVTDVISSPSDADFAGLGYSAIIRLSDEVEGKPYYALLLHMNAAPRVTVGQSVIRGKTWIGEVGDTGRAFGTHVHFELRDFSARYCDDVKWNSPPNIYGLNTSEGLILLRAHWVNPTEYL